MSSYAENEQDAREYAELKRQFAEEEEEEKRLLAKEKPVLTMDEIMYFRKRNELISEINTIVGNNIIYGQPPHVRHHQPAVHLGTLYLSYLPESGRRANLKKTQHEHL